MDGFAPRLRDAAAPPTCPSRSLQVSELLEVTKGEVTDLRASKAKEPAFELQPLLLPEPWPAGSEMVRLIGVVAQRRR